MTIREALGGPWAAHWVVFVGLLPPSTLLVLVREIVTPFPEWWWPLVSALAQHAVAGVVIIAGTAIARRRHALIPAATIIAIWALGAGLRGIVAGVIAEQVAGVNPEFLTRTAVWTIVSIVWVPALVYAIAQFERRRLIVGALDIAQVEVARERPLAAETGAEVQQELRRAIAGSLSPALRDLQASLEASRSSLRPASVAELSKRLSQLHDDTANLLDATLTPEPPASPARATLRRTLDVPPRRPWLTASLVAMSTIVLIVFDAWRVFGPLAALEVVISTIAASLLIGLVPATVAIIRPQLLTAHGQRVTGIAALQGVFVATYLMLNSGIDPITWHGLLIVPILAIGLVFSSGTFLSTIVLADANAEADTHLAELLSELSTMREHHERVVAHERELLSALMHGPVQGRIAACIMALNFHSTSDNDAVQTEELTDAVLQHLRAASRDLGHIAASVSAKPSP